MALDANAEILWRVLLKKVGVTISKGEHIEDKRAWIVRSFGVPSLMQRLRAGMTERERARVWWRECAACSEGDTIPDLSTENLHALNPWIVTESEKYPDPRAARLEKARQVKQARIAEVPATCAQCSLPLPRVTGGNFATVRADRPDIGPAPPLNVANHQNGVTQAPVYAAFSSFWKFSYKR
jgi:hypothetical protein